MRPQQPTFVVVVIFELIAMSRRPLHEMAFSVDFH